MKQTKSLFFFLTLLSYGVALAQFFPKEKDVTAFGGFFNFHYHQEQGKIFLEVHNKDKLRNFYTSMPSEQGSVPMTLDWIAANSVVGKSLSF